MELSANCCRICLRTEKNADKNELWWTVSINEFDSDEVTYEEKYTRCTGIKIVASARLGQLLCGKCLGFLRKMYSFIKICWKADKILKKQTLDFEKELVEEKNLVTKAKKQTVKVKDQNTKYEQVTVETLKTEEVPIDRHSNSDSYDNGDSEIVFHEMCTENDVNEVTNEVVQFENNPPAKDKVQTFICEICGNVYKKKYMFQQHQLTHSNSKDYKCEICGKEFTHQTYLTSHFVRHSGIKRYACSYCSRRFYTKGDLNDHENGVHKHEQVFECDDCGKKFFYQQSLKRHQLCHTNVKPFLCIPCHRTFRTSSNLAQHFQTDVHKDKSTRVFVKLDL